MPVLSTSFSELKKKKVLDADGFAVGNVIDINFDENGEEWFVLGGGFVEETLEMLHIRPDVDLLVPVDWIETIGDDEIVLKLTRFQLTSTCDEHWQLQREEYVRAATRSAFDEIEALRLREYPHRVV
jgi:sporulation protein YlmC with PRC-barrel domain